MRAESDSSAQPQNFARTLKKLLFGLLIGLVSSLVIILIFSIVMTMKDIPQGFVPTLSAIAVAVGGLAGGFTCAKLMKKSGLVVGIISGIILYAVLLLTGLAFGSKGVDLSTLIKLVIAVVCGGMGGIMGVNTRKSRKY